MVVASDMLRCKFEGGARLPVQCTGRTTHTASPFEGESGSFSESEKLSGSSLVEQQRIDIALCHVPILL